MQKLLFHLILSLACLNVIQANQIDSLQDLLVGFETEDEECNAEALYSLYLKTGNAFTEIFEYDSSLYFFEKGYEIANNRLSKEKLIESLFQLGYNYYLIYDYPRALEYLHQALYEAESDSQDSVIASIYDWISIQYLYSEAYGEAIEYQLKSISLREAQQDELGLAESYFSMGGILTAQSKNELAAVYFRKCRKLSEKNDYLYLQSLAAGNISGLFLDDQYVQHLDTVLYYARECINLSIANDDESVLAFGHLLLADYYLKSDLLDSAIIYYKTSLATSIKTTEYSDVGYSLLGLGEVEDKKARRETISSGLSTSLSYYKRALQISRKYELHDLEEEALEKVSDAYFQSAEYDSSYHYQKALAALKDTLFVSKNSSTVSMLETRFNIAQQERAQDAVLLRKNQQIRKVILFACIFGIIVSLAFIWLLFRNFKIQKQSNALLAANNQMIQDQNGKLVRYNEDLKQFAYATSHDLKQPLRTIGSFNTLLERKFGANIDQDSKEYFGFIKRAVNDMSGLLTNLLHYSQLDDKSLSYEYINLNEVMGSVTNNLTQLIKEKNANIMVEYMPRVKANREHMMQLFQNLINNGLKFNTKDYPEIEVTVRHIKNEYQFAVKDNGLGIDKAYSDKIFGLFERLNDPSEFSGSGMGLAISKRIIQHYKGNIWVESTPGAGSIFYFTIPIAEVQSMPQTLKQTG